MQAWNALAVNLGSSAFVGPFITAQIMPRAPIILAILRTAFAVLGTFLREATAPAALLALKAHTRITSGPRAVAPVQQASTHGALLRLPF